MIPFRSRHAGLTLHQCGLALVAVLWMVAALSVLVVGIAAAARSELRAAQGTRGAVEAAALGDAAIQLAALEVRTATEQIEGVRSATLDVAGYPVEVRVAPSGGYVNLNAASENLLAALFEYGAGLDAGAAEAIAQRIVDWRDSDDAAQPRGAELDAYRAAGVPFQPRNGPFSVPEDLLQVLGVELDHYDMIKEFVTVYGGGGAVDPLSAPPGLLAILAGGNAAVAEQFLSLRESAQASGTKGKDIDTTRFDQAYLGKSSGAVYRIEANVRLGGRLYSRVRWVDLARFGADGEPWRTLRIEPVRGRINGEVADGA